MPWQGIDINEEKVLSLCSNHSLIEIIKVVYEIKADALGAFCCGKSMYNVYVADQLEYMGPYLNNIPTAIIFGEPNLGFLTIH